LVKVIVAVYVLGARLFALALTVNVTGVPVVDAVPEVTEGVSQLGKPDIAKLMLPLEALSVYENDDGENGPP
jgi:hypothetical protein